MGEKGRAEDKSKEEDDELTGIRKGVIFGCDVILVTFIDICGSEK